MVGGDAVTDDVCVEVICNDVAVGSTATYVALSC